MSSPCLSRGWPGPAVRPLSNMPGFPRSVLMPDPSQLGRRVQMTPRSRRIPPAGEFLRLIGPDKHLIPVLAPFGAQERQMSPDEGQIDPLTAPWWAKNDTRPPRRFRVWPVDNSGFARSAIAEGVEFSDGTVALRWLRRWPTYIVLSDQGIGAVEAGYIGNGVRGSIEWLDGAHS